jgi:predicted HicB family RNase H-like nuclease
MTPARLGSVPNQPKTPQRTVRVPDAVWAAAKAKAEQRGEVLSDVIRRALERYVKRS